MVAPTTVRKSKPGQEHSLYETLPRLWQKSFAGDYLGLLVLLAAFLFIQFFGEPFHRMFRLDDPRIQFPHAEVERVSVFWLFIYAGAVPLGVLIAWTATFRPSIHQAHVTILGLIVSIVTTLFLTDLFKDVVGRPRPDLIARCKADPSAPQTTLVTIDVCTETNHHVLHDGWRSFPSGHSSFAFSGLGFLAMFLASQTHALRPSASLATVLLCLAPLVGAAMIALSRLEDYRHDVFDVFAGSLLGVSVAFFNWKRYYPSLLSKACSEPHPPPFGGKTSPNGGFQRVRDEEEGLGGSETARYSIGDDGETYGRDVSR